MTSTPESKQDEDRCKFLATCGRLSDDMSPTVTLLLSTSLTVDAIAKSLGVDEHSAMDFPLLKSQSK